jgi:hypothetical protein
MASISFPHWFNNSNPHMMLLPYEDKRTLNLLPPNQLDWMYTLTEIVPDKWMVYGIRNDWNEQFEFVSFYRRVGDGWSFVC